MSKTKSFEENLLEIEKANEESEKYKEKVITEAEASAADEVVKAEESIYDLIAKEGGPDKESIEAWKELYGGKVFISRFDEEELYIFRYIAKPEWKRILQQVENATTADKEDLLDELIFENCVLYPDVNDDLKRKLGAGTIGTIATQIKFKSNFLPDSWAIELVQKI